ncbi:hypothetical protein Tco_0662961 [Tanacetum coccineum]|uniref:Integrase, catalytic region, zinc finger, CCHC-type, peptidase aspartic, catalytic n=1 Tax=Tanacetum coccineum TaxID=301880 RepID=A0ABQ5AP88_9ASTR
MSSNSDDISADGSVTALPMSDRMTAEIMSGGGIINESDCMLGKEKVIAKFFNRLIKDHLSLNSRDALGTTPEGGCHSWTRKGLVKYEDSVTRRRNDTMQMSVPPNCVLQGLPKDIYKLINHNIEAKAIWDNVKMLLAL